MRYCKMGAALIEMPPPRQAGTECDSALQIFDCELRRRPESPFRWQRRDPAPHQHAEIFSSVEFAHKQRLRAAPTLSSARGRAAVIRKIFAQSVQNLAAPLGSSLSSAPSMPARFVKNRDRFHVWIDENFFFPLPGGALFARIKREASDERNVS